MNPSVSFNESRTEMFRKDPELAAQYLEECLKDGDLELFKLALKHVADARLGGMSELSKATKLNRETLYRTLSKKGNPGLNTLSKILSAVGMRMGVSLQ